MKGWGVGIHRGWWIAATGEEFWSVKQAKAKCNKMDKMSEIYTLLKVQCNGNTQWWNQSNQWNITLTIRDQCAAYTCIRPVPGSKEFWLWSVELKFRMKYEMRCADCWLYTAAICEYVYVVREVRFLWLWNAQCAVPAGCALFKLVKTQWHVCDSDSRFNRLLHATLKARRLTTHNKHGIKDKSQKQINHT